MKTETVLSHLKEGEDAFVTGLDIKKEMRKRLLDIGLIIGTKVKCLIKRKNGKTAAYFIRGAVIAIREEDAEKIKVLMCKGEKELGYEL